VNAPRRAAASEPDDRDEPLRAGGVVVDRATRRAWWPLAGGA